MKIFGLHILTESGIKAELKRRNDFDDGQVKFLLRDNTKLRFLVSDMHRRYRKYCKGIL